MMGKLARLVAAGAVSGAIVVSGGCATPEEVAEIRQMAQDAQAAADRAEAAATQAQQSAADASSMAGQAMQAARGAQACCDANTEKMERMFQKSMAK